MRRLKRGLALVLTLCMLLSVVPVITPSVNAADTTTDDFYKIVHLDCGRKYFTVDWIKKLIDEMATDGYTHLELAFGNDGLRFLLDDMSVTVGDTTYSSEAVTAGIQAGNKAYCDFTTNELTQAEMDEIITHANEKGIGIIPLLNTPGHMDAIVTAMGELGISSPAYNGSETTVDLSNAAAVDFTKALVTKYVNYFAGKDCTVFNMGCDEYANDVYPNGGMGFGNLVSTGKYDKFVTYVNDVAAIVKGAGMTPMAFNDGIYFNNNTSSGTFDTDIMISFWTSGWSGYNVASAATIADKGHKMVNTHGAFYYVLGKNDNFDSGSSYASNWDNTSFAGDTTVSDPAGAMFCIWCDYPNAETEEQIYNNVVTGGILSAMSKAMGYTPEETEPDPEPVTVTDDTYGVSVSAPDLKTVVVIPDEAVTKEDGTVSKTYSITLNGGEYTGKATVKIPYDVAFDGCDAFYGKVDGEPFDVRLEEGYFVAEVPHFSDVTIEGRAIEDTKTDTVELTVGETVTRDITGVNYKGTEDRSELNDKIATVVVEGTDATEATTTYTQASVYCNTLLGNDSDSWTAASGYYYTPDGTNYYPVYAKRSSSGRFIKTYTFTWGYSVIDSANEVTPIGNTQDTQYPSITTPDITVYTKSVTAGTPASTTITFTGVSGGTTYITVGDTEYTIIVSKKTAPLNVMVGTTVTLDGTKVTYDGSGDYATIDGMEFTAGDTVVSGLKVETNTTIYTINIIEVDLSTVDPLTIEYWITNGRPTDSDGNTSVSVSAEAAFSEQGLDITSFLPANTEKDGRTLEYWCGRLLDKTLTNSSSSGTEEQTGVSGDDETLNGIVFTKVRFWNNNWQVFTTEWVTVETKHQLVAYYMEVVDIKNSNGESELHVNAADWGTKGDGTQSWGYSPESSRCSVSVQIVYEDGTTNPADTTANSLMTKTFVYGYWAGGRGLGTMIFNGQQNYQIYKVTAETGTMTSEVKNNTYVTVTGFSWQENEETVWEGDATQSVSVGNPARKPSYEEPLDNLTWNTTSYNKNNAILIRVYVRTVATESALTVHYIDQTANTEFYNYNIAVAEGTTFDEGFALGSEKNTLVNNTVTNYNGIVQTVTADLSKMSEIGAQYRYSDYTCVKVERINDGKDVYLYYTFENTHSFVVDFGLPVKITPNDIGISGDWTSAKVTGAKYGTATASVGEGLTYTPNQVITGVESLQLTLIGQTEDDSVTHQIYLYPATTVYYEEGFATYTGSWKDKVVNGNPYESNKGKGTQTASAAGSKANYGYDAKYAAEATGPSDGTEAVSLKNSNDTAEFTFTGTGVDIYANCTTDTGAVAVMLRQGSTSDGTLLKVIGVDTKMANGKEDYTQGQETEGYNIPIVSLTGLDYGDYHVSVIHIKASSDEDNRDGGVKLDGFRVYGTLNESASGSVYSEDDENSPTFIEMRDEVLTAQTVDTTESVYAKHIAEQVYNKTLGTTGAVILSNNTNITDAELKDLLDNGPKNEIYLRKDQSLVFNIATDGKVQIGLKALNVTATCTINGTAKTINSNTDMFYTVTKNDAGTVTIANTGEGILSITKLKISGASASEAALSQLSEEDLVKALVSLGFEESAATRFSDITESKWYYNAVEFVTGRGYFVGITDNLFGPDQTMTRGMFVTVLGRAAKVNKADYADADTGFTDVKSGQYYAPYVAWAKENGIVYGKTETEFCPDMTVTREEMAAFMCRFARYLGLDTTVKDSGWMDRYTDAGAISAYARNSIGWCVEAGIITGTSSTTVSPKDLATRAQVATVIKNLVQKVIERK